MNSRFDRLICLYIVITGTANRGFRQADEKDITALQRLFTLYRPIISYNQVFLMEPGIYSVCLQAKIEGACGFQVFGSM